MSILIESNYKNLIAEAAEDGKKLYLSGVFLQGEVKNRNRRIYPRNIISNAVEKLNESIKNGEDVLGELDHPKDLEISLKNVSHKIESIYMEGNDAIGKALILNTPVGNIARSLIEDGVKIGVSSRGAGDVNYENVVESFDILTVDIVGVPSAQKAYPKGIYEALENYKRYGVVTDLAEAVNSDIKAQKYFKDEILKFIEELNK